MSQALKPKASVIIILVAMSRGIHAIVESIHATERFLGAAFLRSLRAARRTNLVARLLRAATSERAESKPKGPEPRLPPSRDESSRPTRGVQSAPCTEYFRVGVRKGGCARTQCVLTLTSIYVAILDAM